MVQGLYPLHRALVRPRQLRRTMGCMQPRQSGAKKRSCIPRQPDSSHIQCDTGSQEISPEPVLLIVRYSSISWFVVYKFFLLSFTLGSTQEPGGGKTLCLSVSLSLLCSGALCLSVCVYAYAWVNVRVFPSPLFVPLCQCMHACMCVRV